MIFGSQASEKNFHQASTNKVDIANDYNNIYKGIIRYLQYNWTKHNKHVITRKEAQNLHRHHEGMKQNSKLTFRNSVENCVFLNILIIINTNKNIP